MRRTFRAGEGTIDAQFAGYPAAVQQIVWLRDTRMDVPGTA